MPLLPLPSPEEARMLRIRMGLTLQGAAKEIGVSPWSIIRWEKGGNISPDNHREYHKALTRWRDVINNS